MEQVINLLPDALANQIAAGEVIQRPASAVKELLENAVDAGATEIKLILRDAGKTLIQIIDNGKGMSPVDARLCFERHATSKINQSDDLFNIRTFGFRGEALASIAAVAQVELRTRRKEDEVGTKLVIEGSDLKSTDSLSMNPGTQFLVKNLFFNVPARRNFLKSDAIELQHVFDEFIRVALPYPHVSLSLSHNDREVYNLPATNFRKRIVQLFGEKANEQIFPVEEDTTLATIRGFVGKPSFSKKRRGEQFFFVNKRFIRDHYLHNAISSAFDELLPDKYHPSYFLEIEVDPKSIDVNVHPTKTEIKFENGSSLYSILHASVKRGLSQYRVAPSLDFEQEQSLEPTMPSGDIRAPKTMINPDYNPFNSDNSYRSQRAHSGRGWEELYKVVEQPIQPTQTPIFEVPDTGNPIEESSRKFFQLHNRYIIVQMKTGMMMIDQQAAHERILFESFLEMLTQGEMAGQRCLFPPTIQLSPSDFEIAINLLEDINGLGFEMEHFGENTLIVQAIPAIFDAVDAEQFLMDLIGRFRENPESTGLAKREQIAKAMAKSAAIKKGKPLETGEMELLFDHLFACSTPGFSPSGQPTVTTWSLTEIEQKFK